MRIVMFVFIFLFLGAFFIISNDSLHIKNTNELYAFGEKYYGWIMSLTKNIGSLSGYVVKFDWLPENS